MKKLTPQKITGIIICTLAIALSGVIFYFSMDFRASEKVFDKYMTALRYENEETQGKYLLPDAKNDLLKKIESEATEEKEFKSVSYKIKDKEQNGSIFVFDTRTSIFYSDDTSTKIKMKVTMQKDEKWLIKSLEIIE